MKVLVIVLSLLAYLPCYAVNCDSVAYNVARRCIGAGECVLVKKMDCYSIYQNVCGTGFAIVAHDDDGNVRLLGYSPNSSWCEGEMPSALKNWLDGITMFSIPPAAFPVSDKTDVQPLLTSHWHQTSPYNDLAPVIEDGQVKTVAGCVAVAASQIVYYWRKDNPEALLKDTPVYPYGKAPITMSIPKGTPNKWNVILDSYDNTSSEESRAAVAQLVYAVGTGSYLDYGSSTGGSISQAKSAVYSQYELLGENAFKTEYSQEDWEELLYGEVLAKRPVLYSGNTGSGGGHAVVIDGYDAMNNLFHFNFGWGGWGDGYYTVDDMSGVNGYYAEQACVFNMRPKNRNVVTAFRQGEADVVRGTMQVQFCIVNKSTLPVEGLYVFAAERYRELAVDQALASLETEIQNDGQEYSVTMTIPIEGFNDVMRIILTDKYLYPLVAVAFDLSVGISPVVATHDKNCIYSVNGAQQSGLANGLNIVKGTKCTRKVYKRNIF